MRKVSFTRRSLKNGIWYVQRLSFLRVTGEIH